MDCFVACCLLLLLTPVARAVQFERFDDEFDDHALVHAAQDDKRVAAFRKDLDWLRKSLSQLSKNQITKLCGVPQRKEAKRYAFPVAESRGCVLSGIARETARHFYCVEDYAGLEVMYEHSMPLYIIVYLAVDSSFVALTEKNLAKRLAWDRERFDKLVNYHTTKIQELQGYCALAWSPDEEFLAGTTIGKSVVRIVSGRSRRNVKELELKTTTAHGTDSVCAAFSPDGNFLAVGDSNGNVLLSRYPFDAWSAEYHLVDDESVGFVGFLATGEILARPDTNC